MRGKLVRESLLLAQIPPLQRKYSLKQSVRASAGETEATPAVCAEFEVEDESREAQFPREDFLKDTIEVQRARGREGLRRAAENVSKFARTLLESYE